MASVGHVTDQSGAQIGSCLDRSYHTVYTALNSTIFLILYKVKLKYRE